MNRRLPVKKILLKIKLAIGAIKKTIPDISAIIGAVCISYGAYLFIKPLGYIVLGCLLIVGGYVWSKEE